MFIWLGDASYLDLPGWKNRNTFVEEPHMRKRFQDTKNEKGYDLMEQTIKIIGVWDDHDYGINDGDRTFPNKNQSREVYLDFIGEG